MFDLHDCNVMFLIFVLNTLVLLDLHTEVGKQFHKKGAEYANDFLNSSVSLEMSHKNRFDYLILVPMC
jgi:hypothetical protein